MKISASLLLLFAIVLSPLSRAGDWPGYLGPEGRATASEEDAAGVPTDWSDTDNLLWKADLPGAGSSSPIVVGDRIFVTCYTGLGGEGLVRHLVCVDAEDGEIVWTESVEAIEAEDPYRGFLTEHGYASNTPACDGERVFAFFGKSGVHCFDLDGELLWQAEVGTGSSPKAWGSASSPLLYGGLVIVLASDESRTIFAIDKKTGEVVWEEKASLLDQTYSTPVIMRREGGREDLVIAAPQELWGMDPLTGDLRWYAEHGLPGNISPSPVIAGDLVLINGGYPRNGRLGIRPAMEGATEAEGILWDESNASYIPTPVLHEGHLYMVNDQGFAMCSEVETGELVYKERVEQLAGAGGRNRPVYASPVLVDDRVVCVTRLGGTIVLAAKPEFEVLAHNVFASDKSQFNATPAVAHGSLILRSDTSLYRVGSR